MKTAVDPECPDLVWKWTGTEFVLDLGLNQPIQILGKNNNPSCISIGVAVKELGAEWVKACLRQQK